MSCLAVSAETWRKATSNQRAKVSSVVVVALLALAVSRRMLAGLVAAVSLAGLAWFFFGDSDERKIRARLDELANAVETKQDESIVFRALRLRKVFDEVFEPEASLRAPELQDATGVKDLTALAAAAPRHFGDLDVNIGKVDLHIEPAANQARATAEVIVSGTMGGELRRDERAVTFMLRKRDGEWRIELIEVAEKREAG
jgi:ketosteroid isomerase-like protein